MKNYTTNTNSITLEYEDVIYSDSVKTTVPSKHIQTFTYNTHADARNLVDMFYEQVKDLDPYISLFASVRADTRAAKKLLIAQLMIEELNNTRVKYHTKSNNEGKRAFRLSLAMISKLAQVGKSLSTGREIPVIKKVKKNNKNIFKKLLWK